MPSDFLLRFNSNFEWEIKHGKYKSCLDFKWGDLVKVLNG